MTGTEVLAVHQTKAAAYADGKARRAAGTVVFVMRAADAARFLGVVVSPRAWVVYR